MPRDSRLSRPQDYVDETRLKFLRNNKVDYGEAFKSKPSEPPFTINRFDASDLQNKLKKGLGKKQVLNPRLNFVGGDPQAFQLLELYSFEEGRPNTKSNFTQYPEYKPMWAELYNVSPTVADKSSNPMPRTANPDPQNILRDNAELAAENEVEGKLSVAQLLQGQGAAEVKEGEKISKDKKA
jgi:hypothetical protein